jgi:hypothetical protein
MADEDMVVEEVIFADAFAERGEAIRKLAFALDAVQDKDGKDAVLKAMERLTLSIAIAESKTAVLKGLKRDNL